MRSRDAAPAVAGVVASLGLLAGCTSAAPGQDGPAVTPVISAQPTEVAVQDMVSRNQSRHVDPLFDDHPLVISEEYGLTTSELLFEYSDGVVIADEEVSSQLRAASLAVFAHVPMLTYHPSRRQDIIAEVQRLKATRILLVGEVPFVETTGTPLVFRDPGGMEALGQLTAHQFTPREVTREDNIVAEVTELDGAPVVLVPAWEEVEEPADSDVPALPVQTRRDGLNAPVTVATAETPIASVANAQAYGANVRVLDDPDPRRSDTAFAAMVSLHDQPLLALGGQFGTDETLAAAIKEAEARVMRREPSPRTG